MRAFSGSVKALAWRWFASRCELVAHLKRLERRLARKDDEIACLRRQLETSLETLDTLRWGARRETAMHMAQVSQLGVMQQGPGQHGTVR